MQLSPPSLEQSRNLDIGISGIKQILNPNSSTWKRLAWLSLLMTCTAAVIYQLYDRISYYFSEPINIHVASKENDTIMFPSVNVCPSLFTSFFLTTMMSLYLIAKENNLTHTDQWCPNEKELMKKLLYGEDVAPIDMNQFWQLLAMDKSAITATMSTTFLGTNFNDEEPLALSIKDSIIPWTKCLTINLEEPIRINGETTITFTIPIFQLLPILNNVSGCVKEFNRPDFLELGLTINDFGTPMPHGYDVNQFVRVLPGQTVAYRLTIRELFNVYTKKHPCQEDWFHSYLEYETCIKKTISYLNYPCSIPFTNFTGNRLCDSPKDLTDAPFELSIFLLEEKSYIEECSQLKNRLCHEKKFTAEHKYSTNFSVDHTVEIKFIIHDRFYESVQEEYTYLLPALISDIGGSLGVFLGICVLTVVEILEAIFFQLCIKLQNWSNVK